MATASADELSSPFLSKMLGKLQVLSTNLRCTKQSNGKYLYEYSIQVHPEQEDEDLADILRPEGVTKAESADGSTHANSTYASSGENQSTTSSVNRSYHSEINCVYMVTVRFVLFHRNINGKAQATTRAEFSSRVPVRQVIEYFRSETAVDHHGEFKPRLAYSIGRGYDKTYPLTSDDLDKPLSELIGEGNDVNTLSIIADVC
ncbi:unnamed protein product [Cylicocyclus nassatus]|uniref:Uncharacterized protein n=1 Tax=Cylicocyclus nassatus TaxID=53992 RepID=A0AA36DKT2_CYLNA|nr:unnamed protein product [Cylicocyclus nassatus]